MILFSCSVIGLMECVMSSGKNVIEKIKAGIAPEAQARGTALRRSFTPSRPAQGWLRWLIGITLISVRGWVYIVALVIAVAYFMHNLPPTDLLQNWQQMRGQ
ncbi:hypothetical protein [Thalassospira sp.]|uniref:hypothetical protein n=1 Tax=Thalassospira sp. TaxID=1912094 RepID=UPI0032EBF83E